MQETTTHHKKTVEAAGGPQRLPNLETSRIYHQDFGEYAESYPGKGHDNHFRGEFLYAQGTKGTLLAVMDGMGEKGQEAARASLSIRQTLEKLCLGLRVQTAEDARDFLKTVQAATKIDRESSTLTVALAFTDETGTDRIGYFHSGDSRLYVAVDSELIQLTHDHNWLYEVRNQYYGLAKYGPQHQGKLKRIDEKLADRVYSTRFTLISYLENMLPANLPTETYLELVDAYYLELRTVLDEYDGSAEVAREALERVISNLNSFIQTIPELSSTVLPSSNGLLTAFQDDLTFFFEHRHLLVSREEIGLLPIDEYGITGVVLTTDGVTDNLTESQLRNKYKQLSQSNSSMQAIADSVGKAAQASSQDPDNGRGKPDDVTILAETIDSMLRPAQVEFRKLGTEFRFDAFQDEVTAISLRSLGLSEIDQLGLGMNGDQSLALDSALFTIQLDEQETVRSDESVFRLYFPDDVRSRLLLLREGQEPERVSDLVEIEDGLFLFTDISAGDTIQIDGTNLCLQIEKEGQGKNLVPVFFLTLCQ